MTGRKVIPPIALGRCNGGGSLRYKTGHPPGFGQASKTRSGTLGIDALID